MLAVRTHWHRWIVLFLAAMWLVGCAAPISPPPGDEPAAPVTEDEPAAESTDESDSPDETEAEEPAPEESEDDDPYGDESDDESPSPDLLAVMESAGAFYFFFDLLHEAQLDQFVAQQSPLVIFAPVDDAFERLPEETLDWLFRDRERLRTILLGHMLHDAPLENCFVGGEMTPTDDSDPLSAGRFPTLGNTTVAVVHWEDLTKVDNARVVGDPLPGANGVICPIDTVLLPMAPPPTEAPDYLDPEIETWIPYEEGEEMDLGDAQLVAGTEEEESLRFVHESVQMFGDYLQYYEELYNVDVQLNLARTVLLETPTEAVYLAPVGPNAILNDFEAFQALAAEEGVVSGIVTYGPGLRSDPAEGPYIVRTRYLGPNEWFIEYLDPAGEVVDRAQIDMETEQAVDLDKIPTAAIFYGSVFCVYRFTVAGVQVEQCFFCRPSQGDSLSACREQL